MHTNAIAQPEKRYSLAEMSAVFLDRSRVPYGFVISEALWKALDQRWRQEGNGVLGPGPTMLQGVKIVVDPAMPDTEFEVAFTREAWRKRTALLGSPRGHTEAEGK